MLEQENADVMFYLSCRFLREFEKHFSLRDMVVEMQQAHPEMYPFTLKLMLSRVDKEIDYATTYAKGYIVHELCHIVIH